MDESTVIPSQDEIDLTKKTSAELEDMGREWSGKIWRAEENLQTVQRENSELKKRVIDLSDAIKKARHVLNRLEREKTDIRTAMFRKLREGL